MTEPRDLATSADRIDTGALASEWSWLVPADHRPLLVGAFGDVVFGAPDGSLSLLDLLEGQYRLIATSGGEFNEKKKDPENLTEWFSSDWVEIAERHGLVPDDTECLGWKVHPALGGPFAVENIEIFSIQVYHSLTGQLFKQLSGHA